MPGITKLDDDYFYAKMQAPVGGHANGEIIKVRYNTDTNMSFPCKCKSCDGKEIYRKVTYISWQGFYITRHEAVIVLNQAREAVKVI